MAIFVDKVRRWPQPAKPGLAQRYFGNGKPSCHMWSDQDDLELIAFAKRIGLSKAWIQRDSPIVHFDLTPSKRDRAILMGAIERELTLADFDPNYEPPHHTDEGTPDALTAVQSARIWDIER